MSDTSTTTGRVNKQDHNVGNRGDILKHAALVALAELMALRSDLYYLETHAYRLVAPCNVKRWHRKVEPLRGERAYARYVALEKRWIDDGRRP
jgi:hypothetical protein